MRNTDEKLKLLPELLLPWYAENRRDLPWRRDRDPYRVWVSEVMLQQTRVEAAKGYYLRFLEALPTVEALAACPDERLMKLWEGLGYYSRARNLKKAAQIVVSEYGGQFPQTRDELRALPGIGEYTAGALCSLCFGQPIPAVDGNVLRVLGRYLPLEADIALPETKRAAAEMLAAVYPAGRCAAFTEALMELGATVCLPNGAPACARCPLAAQCFACVDECWRSYPKKSPKRQRRTEDITVLLLRCAGKTALRRRPDTGLLAGLWELPNLPGALSQEQALAAAADFGCRPLGLLQLRRRKHIFTHIEWHMCCYEIVCGETPACFRWADGETLRNDSALPSAFRLFL